MMINYVKIKKRLKEMGIYIEWDNEVSDIIALKGYSPEYGARPIKRKIRHLVEDEISEMILNKKTQEGSRIKISVNGEYLTFNLID